MQIEALRERLRALGARPVHEGRVLRQWARAEPQTQGKRRPEDFLLCADIQGFSLHAAVPCGADDRQALEQLCRYITRPALANEHVQTDAAGQVVLKLKTPGATAPRTWRCRRWSSCSG